MSGRLRRKNSSACTIFIGSSEGAFSVNYKITLTLIVTRNRDIYLLQLFAYANNIYYQPDPSSSAIQLTFNGDSKYIFNGVADWLYEGTIFYPVTVGIGVEY
jgi:hypothetical protein